MTLSRINIVSNNNQDNDTESVYSVGIRQREIINGLPLSNDYNLRSGVILTLSNSSFLLCLLTEPNFIHRFMI